jgi:hypothetical protein
MLTLLFSLRDCCRTRAALQAEILAPRHQLLVLQRSSRRHRLRLGWADRVLWAWLSRLWNDWQSALLIVKPETVIAWHRRGFRLYWTWKSRRCEGRPTVSPEVRNLIRQMSLANPRWGAPRIHGELLKLGIQISQGTVAKYMVRRRKPPSQSLCLLKTPYALFRLNLRLRICRHLHHGFGHSFLAVDPHLVLQDLSLAKIGYLLLRRLIHLLRSFLQRSECACGGS